MLLTPSLFLFGVVGLVTGLAAGRFAWPMLWVMGVAWPIIPLFVVAVAGIAVRYGGRAAFCFGFAHFIGCLCAYVLPIALAVLRYDVLRRERK